MNVSHLTKCPPGPFLTLLLLSDCGNPKNFGGEGRWFLSLHTNSANLQVLGDALLKRFMAGGNGGLVFVLPIKAPGREGRAFSDF